MDLRNFFNVEIKKKVESNIFPESENTSTTDG